MTSVRGRGRGMGGPRGGGTAGSNERNGSDGANSRRGSWRGGPPGSNNSFSNARGGSPGPGMQSGGARTSINDHMNLMGTVTDDKARSASAKGFQTDTDISNSGKQGAHRELQPWAPDASNVNGANGQGKSAGGRDAETFGLEVNSKTPWDQFETNARLFGATTNYEEELYTTKLDRSSAGYKQREKEANRLAGEIMGQAATNSHVAEERGQVVEGAGKDEEEKYSGVQRAANAYVPPGARRSAAQGTVSGRAPSGTSAGSALAKENGSAPVQPPQPPQPSKSSQLTETMSTTNKASPAPVRNTSDVAASETPASASQNAVVSQPASVTQQNKEEKQEKTLPPASVVDQFRSFVGSEREKVEAKKQSMVKQERERTLADLKKFQSNFKVPLPMPKDILPLLAKDAEKQKAIEEKAAQALEDAKKKTDLSSTKPAPTPQSRKISMKIPEIPPFKPKAPPVPPVIPIADSASKDIPLATSPTPSTSSHLSANPPPKLNPKASSFVFKPNPAAASFKPGQSSSIASPSTSTGPLPSTATAGPSMPKPQNSFFREQPPPMKGIDPRSDFNPWKQGPLPAASSINPQWPFTGRKYTQFMPMGPFAAGPMGFDDEQSPTHGIPPHLMGGLPPNYPAYAYRFQPGMPPQGVPNPMFSPGSQFQQLPSGPIPGQAHMGGPNGPMGMPMHFYQNGMHQNPQFIPPNLAFNPNARGGPGGPPGHGNPMFFQHQHQHSHSSPTPQHTPQVHQAGLQHPSAPYSPVPPGQPQLSPGNSFENGRGGGGGH